jgi:MtaA/CmuA family methyltransferase
MRLRNYFSSLDRFGVVPILGYAGLEVAGLTAPRCLQDPESHARLIQSNLRHFEPDAVISLMDLTVESEVYGVKPTFSDFDPPQIRSHLTCEAALSVKQPEVSTKRMSLMIELARRVSELVKDVPIGFFVTGPFTLVGQIVGIQELLIGISRSEASISELLENCTETVVSYARRLVDAGAGFLMIADMSTSLISPRQFTQFAREPLRTVVKAVSTDVVLHVCGRANHLLKHMSETGASAISIDQNVSLPNAVQAVPSSMLVFGNYSPTDLAVEEPDIVIEKVTQMLRTADEAENVVASTGCDLPSSTPVRNIRAFVGTVKSHQRR